MGETIIIINNKGAYVHAFQCMLQVLQLLVINNYYKHYNTDYFRVPTILLIPHTPSTTLTLPRATSVTQSHFLLQLVMMEFVLTS